VLSATSRFAAELGERGAADRADVSRSLGDRRKDRLAGVDQRSVPAGEDRTVAAFDHRAGAAHGRVEERDAGARRASARRRVRVGEIVLI
jgi:hypothetical protein